MATTAEPAAIRAVVIGSNDYDFHRIEEQGPLLAEFLRVRAGTEVEVSDDRDALREASISAYDVVIDYTTNGDLTDEQWAGLREFVRDGGGYVGLHGASAVYWDTESPREELEALIGGAFEGHGAFDRQSVEIVARDHPITSGIEDYSILDEPYECRVNETARVLAYARHDELGDLPMVWTKRYGEGRVAYCANGHDERAFVHPTYQTIVTRAVEWAAGRS